jgi:hypothetical protein
MRRTTRQARGVMLEKGSLRRALEMKYICADCGARYDNAEDSCTVRFDQLLALDHSRQEPWGSRHGLAFAVFALQHPNRYHAATRARSFELLERVFLRCESTESVIGDFRARGSDGRSNELPSVAGPFSYTIADCGSFDAADYVARLEQWCRNTLEPISKRYERRQFAS